MPNASTHPVLNNRTPLERNIARGRCPFFGGTLSSCARVSMHKVVASFMLNASSQRTQMHTAPGEGLIGSVTRDLIVTRGDFHVRLAEREEWLDQSRTLISNMYSWRGYS